jgi:RNA polymerase sigma factor (sigma-70 family)
VRVRVWPLLSRLVSIRLARAAPFGYKRIMAWSARHADVSDGVGPWFNTTHWSVVLAAGDTASARAAEALEKLCRAYWYPLYTYVRRRGYQPEDAEDLTQDFFARLLARRDLELVRRERGRFRSYLLVSLNHFLTNEWKRERRAKRGGGRALIPLHELMAEENYAREPATTETPDKLFERRWARTLLERVLDRLGAEGVASGRGRQFACLRGFLSDQPAPRSQAELAVELNTSEGAVKQAVHRLRRRYRELLREEIANTVATAGDVEDELRHLIAVLRP